MFFPGQCRNFFRIFGRNVLARCSKLHFNCPEEHNSWEKQLLKMLIFSQIRIWTISCLKILGQFFASLEKIAMQVSTETFWRNNVFFWPIPNFFVYGFWPMQFWTLKEKYFVSFVNTAFNVSRGSIGWNFFLQRIRIVQPFLDFEWKISWIPAGKLCHSCRKCSCVSRLRFPAVLFVEIVQILIVLFVFWLI